MRISVKSTRRQLLKKLAVFWRILPPNYALIIPNPRFTEYLNVDPFVIYENTTRAAPISNETRRARLHIMLMKQLPPGGFLLLDGFQIKNPRKRTHTEKNNPQNVLFVCLFVCLCACCSLHSNLIKMQLNDVPAFLTNMRHHGHVSPTTVSNPESMLFSTDEHVWWCWMWMGKEKRVVSVCHWVIMCTARVTLYSLSLSLSCVLCLCRFDLNIPRSLSLYSSFSDFLPPS